MPECRPQIPADVWAGFDAFCRNQTEDRLFAHPIGHHSQQTGFCPCEGPLRKALGYYVRAGLLLWVLRGPFNGLKVWYLRRLGARIGRNVYIAADTWIDPLFPQLLTIEDDVTFGVGVKVALHEFRMTEFRAGKVIIRKGALIGGFSLIGCGVEIGQNATVGPGAAVYRDVPPGSTAYGNPMRLLAKDPQLEPTANE